MSVPHVVYNPFTNNLDYANTGGAGGDVVGPSSSVNNNIVLFDGVTGKLLKDSGHSLTEYLLVAQNLADVADKTISFNNLSPNSVKGDWIVFNGTNNIRLPVGTDTFMLVANSAQASGLQWVAQGSFVGSITGTLNRILIGGTSTNPTVDIDPNYVGQASITTLGTIATGTWNATAISAIHGGTAQTTYTTGDILYASAANTLSKLAATSNGFVLTLAAGIPSWAAPATSGTVTSVSGVLNRTTSTGGNTPIIDISASYVGQSSITTLGTITTGVWNGTNIALANGGTNASLTASNGGIFYSTASAVAILAGTSTANKVS